MLSVASVITRFFPAFSQTRRLRVDVHRAATAIMRCGTAGLGAHVQRCECGHIERIAYNSCRHRSCPTCRGGQRAAWLERISGELLRCKHVHVIFTVPAELNELWRFNRVAFANLLMQAARESLRELLADPKYLGALPGIISVLHTWGRNLSVHPHVHCLVTAGGLDSSGAFVEQRRKSLLPARVLMAVFRGKFRCFLLAALAEERLALPSGLSDARARSLLNRLGRTAWNVRIQETYSHGVSVAGYLARYITGGPISDRRLFSIGETTIAFRYRDYRDGEDKLMRLHPHEFLARWFEHVPPHGLRLIRRSGLYANCYAELRRKILDQQVAENADSEEATPLVRPLEEEYCPLCNTAVIRRPAPCAASSLPTNQNVFAQPRIDQPP